MSERAIYQKNLTDFEILDIPTIPDHIIRYVKKEEIEKIGKLYFNSYDPEFACKTEKLAIEDIEYSFAGEYGPLLIQASKVLIFEDEIIGAVLVVERNSWDKNITCPYIIEFFIAPNERRKKLGTHLMQECLLKLKDLGYTDVALTVDILNKPGMNFYNYLEFEELIQGTEEDQEESPLKVTE